jgi:hypothetical protein
VLDQSMRKVGEMDEDVRRRLIDLPPPPSPGSRQRQALDLRARGASYQEIGDELGVSAQRAFQVVSETLERLTGDEVRSVEVARQLELVRLDCLLQAQWGKAMAGSTDAATACLKIMERRSKYLGLDAPLKINVEDRIRQVALAEGLDPEEALEEARAIIRSLPPN